MSYAHFERLLKQGLVPDGACVAAALDAVSKHHDIDLQLYEISARAYLDFSRGSRSKYTIEQIYQMLSDEAGSGNVNEWVQPDENTEECLIRYLKKGNRIIGEITGYGHTVGLIREWNHFNFVGIGVAERSRSIDSGKLKVSKLQYFLDGMKTFNGWIRILPPG